MGCGDAGRRGHAQLLTTLVRGVSIVGLVAAAFGPAYSWLLLRLLYSTRWADTGAPAALGAYAGYIVLLAVNGILEACAVSRGPSESSPPRPQCSQQKASARSVACVSRKLSRTYQL